MPTTYDFSVGKRSNKYKSNQITTTNVVSKIKEAEKEGHLDVDSLHIDAGASPRGTVTAHTTSTTQAKGWLDAALKLLFAKVDSIEPR